MFTACTGALSPPDWVTTAPCPIAIDIAQPNYRALTYPLHSFNDEAKFHSPPHYASPSRPLVTLLLSSSHRHHEPPPTVAARAMPSRAPHRRLSRRVPTSPSTCATRTTFPTFKGASLMTAASGHEPAPPQPPQAPWRSHAPLRPHCLSFLLTTASRVVMGRISMEMSPLS
jgi:hypothetical protein